MLWSPFSFARAQEKRTITWAQSNFISLSVPFLDLDTSFLLVFSPLNIYLGRCRPNCTHLKCVNFSHFSILYFLYLLYLCPGFYSYTEGASWKILVKPARLHFARTARALRDATYECVSEASCPNFEPRTHARITGLTRKILDLDILTETVLI